MEGPLLQELASTRLERRSRFDFTLEVLMSYPKANYDNPVKRGPELYVLNSTFFAVMVICVIIRLYTRLCIRKWFGWDDFFILLAVVGATGVTACVMLGTHEYNWDRHIYDIRMNLLQPSAELMFASKILWSFTSNSVRASVMCLYYRLLGHVGMNQYRWVLHANSVFIFGIFITQQATTIFACRPIKTVWTWPPITTSKCIDNGAALFTGAVLNTFSEAIVAVLPLPIIFMLNVTHHQRNMIIGMLCGGFLVVVVGCVRTYFVWQMIATFDPSWWAMPHWIASEVEMDVAIICACIPAITPVLRRVARGGLSAVKQVDPLPPGSAGTDYRTTRTRMFFTKLNEDSSAALTTSSTRSEPSTEQSGSQRTIDIEGIKPDGFGYTVTITTGRGTKVRRRWDIRNKVWHYYPEQDVSDVGEEEEDTTTGPRKRSVFSQSRKRSGSGPRTSDGEKRTMEVQTETTFNVRESFHSQKFDRGFDYRNPYKGDKYEEDLEIGIQVPEAAVSDWSMFDEEMARVPSSRKMSAPETGTLRRNTQEAPIASSPAVPSASNLKRRGSSYDSQRFSVSQRHSTESVRPKTGSSRIASSHKGSQSYDNIRMGVLPSPSTANFDFSHRALSRPQSRLESQSKSRAQSPPLQTILRTPAPPALPAAARVRRSTSPAINPVNSSHPWITSTFLGQTSSDESSRNGANSPHTDSDGYQTSTVSKQPRASLVGHGRKSSIQSSLRAENGSGRSLAMAMQRNRFQRLPQGDKEESSDDELELPLQRPSPRTSVAYEREATQQRGSRAIPTMQVRRLE